MKKFYIFVAVSSLVMYAMARERIPFSDVFFTYNDKYDNFQNAFKDRFDSNEDIWMVLGNRGVKDYYRERFSKNWIYWDDHSSSDNLGITGDYLNTENWVEVAKKLPKKISYIAADFNDLISHSKRDSVIIAAKNVLKQGGVFCVEDDFDNNKKKFDHFSKQELAKLSNEFKIDYVLWDGYISALPYTCDQSNNVKTDMYKGIEAMILRLAAADSDEKRKMLPHITWRLYLNTFRVKKSLIARLVRDIINSNDLNQMIKRYEEANGVVGRLNAEINKINAEVAEIKKEIAKYEKLIKFSQNVSSRFSRFSKRFSRFSKNAKSVKSRMNLFSENKGLTDIGKEDAEEVNTNNKPEESKRSSFMDRFSKVINGNKEEGNTEDKLNKKKVELEEKQTKLEEINRDLVSVNEEIKNIEEKIMKYNDACFVEFERDKYLKKYLTYKKTKLAQVISDSKISNIEFWDDYDNKAFFHIETITDLDVLARELEKSWSPDVLLQNKVPLKTIRTNASKSLKEKTKVVIMFTKK